MGRTSHSGTPAPACDGSQGLAVRGKTAEHLKADDRKGALPGCSGPGRRSPEPPSSHVQLSSSPEPTTAGTTQNHAVLSCSGRSSPGRKRTDNAAPRAPRPQGTPVPPHTQDIPTPRGTSATRDTPARGAPRLQSTPATQGTPGPAGHPRPRRAFQPDETPRVLQHIPDPEGHPDSRSTPTPGAPGHTGHPASAGSTASRPGSAPGKSFSAGTGRGARRAQRGAGHPPGGHARPTLSRPPGTADSGAHLLVSNEE